MENKTLVKLCKDCNLVDKKLTTTDIDLIFTKHK
jgi:translation initiation factor 2 beta subunit (eIF-2beta)/eIF-5